MDFALELSCHFRMAGYPLKLHFQMFPEPIYVICDYYIHKTDLADLSRFNFFFEIFAANIEISFTFRIREFTT